MVRRLLVVLAAIAPTVAAADGKQCVDAQFTPTDHLQIVAWLETGSGQYVDTLFITQQTGSFGLGNRPGRYDFNSGPMWPYGRRIDTFPVWSHRNGQSFPAVIFQNDPNDDPAYCASLSATDPSYVSCGENNLSHPTTNSSVENHYCQPLVPGSPAFDAMTCPSPSFTDKGKLSTTATTGYPPRTDLSLQQYDSPSIAMYKALDPFDAVSQPTPIGGSISSVGWPVPDGLADGDYVLYVETALESDFNASYDSTSQPSPSGIAWSGYGVPTRGQPSILYAVPITIQAGTTTSGSTTTYAGYGDPSGADGDIRPPDSTITTTTPGTGASRLELVAGGGAMYRVLVTSAPDDGTNLPGTPAQLATQSISGTDANITFVAPSAGIDAVAGYDIRVLANTPMTDDNFDDATPITTRVDPTAPGSVQGVDVTGLLPLTDYWIGIRAFNGCHDEGPLAVIHVTTSDRDSGTVDACFVATAAYGSILANDVELLRHFRDTWLETNVLGELGVETYYTFGPALAGIVGESELLRSTARDLLAPVVHVVERALAHTVRR
ncbi:MAG TPA: fibronectin type III domain-containing protein [Kofleriaceae bacterium]